MQEFWIIGGGKFGRRAAETIGRAGPAADILIVEKDPRRCQTLIADGFPVIVGLHWYIASPPQQLSGDSFVPPYIDDIREAMADERLAAVPEPKDKTAAGAASFVAGGLILFNSFRLPGLPTINVPLVVGTGIFLAAFFFVIVTIGIRAQKAPVLTGKQVIHPNHIHLCKVAFTPSPSEIKRNIAILKAAVEADALLGGAIRFEGEMLDPPMFGKALQSLLRARALRSLSEQDTRFALEILKKLPVRVIRENWPYGVVV